MEALTFKNSKPILLDSGLKRKPTDLLVMVAAGGCLCIEIYSWVLENV